MDAGRAAVIAALVAAVGGVATAVLTATLKDDAGPKGAGQQVTATAKPAQTPDAIRTTVTTAGTSEVTAQAVEDSVFHEGDLTLVKSGYADLDAPPDNAQWDNDPGVNDLRNDGYQLSPSYFDVDTVTVERDDATVCQQTSGYAHKPVPVKQGRMFCVKTDGGRMAFVKIINASSSSINLHVRSYRRGNE